MTDAQRPCPTCKALLDPGDQFCGFCGSPVTSQPPTPPPPPSSGPPRPSPAPHAATRRPTPEPPTPASPPPEKPAAEAPPEPVEPKPSDVDAPPPATEGMKPGFWIRNRGWGLLLLRLGLGFLLLYGWNPSAMGDFGSTEEYEIVGDLPYWVEVAVYLDLPQLYFGMVGTHMAAGFLILLGLFFRPACFAAAASYGVLLAFQVAWAGEFMALIDLAQSGSMMLVFLGLMFAGPGRLALGGAERKAR